ncbi:MAG: DUF1778 domain-containing protein [Solirubrobacterales bacterium]|nr:DUF1778 domain-containing protein [Solirubrobacterales bacterium]
MRTSQMNLQLAPEADARIRRAAAASGVSTSAFVQRAASAAADAVLAGASSRSAPRSGSGSSLGWIAPGGTCRSCAAVSSCAIA